MKVPTKKSFKIIVIYLATLVITYLMIKGLFSNIEWDDLLAICLVSFITLLIICDKEEKNRNTK